MKRKSIKKSIVTGISIFCLAGILTGCKEKAPATPETSIQEESDVSGVAADNLENESTKEENIQEEDTQEGEKEPLSESGKDQEEEKESQAGAAALRSGVADWEVENYKDKYLSYELPKSWAKNTGQSNDAMLFAFFQSQNPKTQYPSNVNVQISQLNTGGGSRDIDYASEEIQKEFHQFLLSDMGLPAEAANGTFSVIKTGKGIYVYSLGFERKAMDDTTAHQTIYLPMGMEHAIVIWATDFKEGAEVSADNVALRICETLEILE